MSMNVNFLGGVDTVTGSCHLVTAGSKRILVDCGVEQGESFKGELSLPDIGDEVDYCFLTHAHLDHSALIPLLIKKKKVRTAVISTAPTRMVVEILLHDFINVYKNTYGEIPYTEKDMDALFSRWITYDYNQEISLSKMVKARFFDASHIIGSASLLIEYASKYNVFFSGDLGTKNTMLLKHPPKHPKSVNYIVIESTYGDMEHKNNIDKAINFIKNILNSGGKVLIPSFSVGRSQEIIYALNKSGIGRKWRIYLDSPMSHKVTMLSGMLSPFLKPLPDLNKNLFNGYIPVNKMKDSLSLAKKDEPCVIVSASGMLTGGRVLTHYNKIKNDKKSGIVFVGYQAEGTLGRKIVDKKVDVQCKIFVAHGFSAHADRRELLDYIKSFKSRPKKIFLTHGEENQRHALSELLDGNGFYALLPKKGCSYELEKGNAVSFSEITEEEKMSYGFEKITAEEFKQWFMNYLSYGYIGMQKLEELIVIKESGINNALSWCKINYDKGRLTAVADMDNISKRDKIRIKRDIYNMFCSATVWISLEELKRIRKELIKFKKDLKKEL